MLNVYVIGCGGIGGYLIKFMPMVISSLTLDLMPEGMVESALSNMEMKPLLPVVDRLVLIDGDRFDVRNAVRQMAGAGGKVEQRIIWLKQKLASYARAAENVKGASEELKTIMELLTHGRLSTLMQSMDVLTEQVRLTQELLDDMNREMIRVSALQSMRIVGVRRYLTPNNIGLVIPKAVETKVTDEARDMWGPVMDSRKDAGLPSLNSTVVFLCVDNGKTRYEVQKYMEGFDNCLLINGGNAKVTGQVNVYEKADGVAKDPTLYAIYPDINPDEDLRPDERGCEAVAPRHEQIAITNSIVADFMLSCFVKWARVGLNVEKRGKMQRYNEILINIEMPSLIPVNHPL